MVLAEPAACIPRRSINSQYAEVGTSARPTQDRDRSTKQATNIGLRPQRSENVPHTIGAMWMSVSRTRQVGRRRHTKTLHDHVNGDRQIDQLCAFVELRSDHRDSREVDVRGERTG